MGIFGNAFPKWENGKIIWGKKHKPVHKPKPVETPSEEVVKKPNLDDPVFITGKDVTYTIPPGMNSLIVEIRDENGNYLNSYTLSSYVNLSSGMNLRIIVK